MVWAIRSVCLAGWEMSSVFCQGGARRQSKPVRKTPPPHSNTSLVATVKKASNLEKPAASKRVVVVDLSGAPKELKISIAPIAATAQANEIVFDNDAEWDDSAKERFNQLSQQFALGRLTPIQTTEYENLKILRRRENPSRSFEQIKADIEFHQAVRAAIAGLQQLIDHGTRTFRA